MPPSADHTFHSLALAEAGDGDVSAPFPVLYTGDFEWMGRKYKVSDAALDEAVRNFNAMKAGGYEPPIDVEHARHYGKDAPAVGHYKELIRKGKQLLARVQWNADGKEQIRAGRRRYFSPEFTLKAKDELGKDIGFALLSGSLVTRPHLKQLGPVALSEPARVQLAEDTDEMQGALDSLVALTVAERPAVAKDPDKTENTIILAEGTVVKVGDAEITLGERHIEVLAGNDPKPESDETVVALRDTVTALSARVETAESALFTEQFTAFMSQAHREGRIDAKDETTTKWRERAEKLGLEETKSLMADIPAETIAMSERGHGNEGPGAKPETEVPDGVNPDAHRLHERAVALSEEKNIDYAEAAHMAVAEVQE